MPLRYWWIAALAFFEARVHWKLHRIGSISYPRVISMNPRRWIENIRWDANSMGAFLAETNGVGPATGEFRIRWTRIIEKRIQVYDIWTMLGRILTVRYTCVSGIRMIHSTREFPRGPRGMFNFSSPLGTNFSAFLFHACAQFEQLPGNTCAEGEACLHDEWGQYRDIRDPFNNELSFTSEEMSKTRPETTRQIGNHLQIWYLNRRIDSILLSPP